MGKKEDCKHKIQCNGKYELNNVIDLLYFNETTEIKWGSINS